MYILIYYRAIVHKVAKLIQSLSCTTKLLNSMQRKIYAYSYTPLFTGPTMQFDQSTEYCLIARLIRVGCCTFYSSKIHTIGYILLQQKPLKTPETLKEKFAVVSIQTKHLVIVMKVVRNQHKLEHVFQFWENE